MNELLDMFNASMLAELTDGELLGNPDAGICRARADSRICQTGDLFVALPGRTQDGSQFVLSAWEEGAEAALVSKSRDLPAPPPGKSLVIVDDARTALLKAARARREAAKNLRVVGITGSNGKTTTKDILAAIMEAWKGSSVLHTQGNYNSDIGLPLTLFDLRSRHEFAVLEMGMNRIGEIALLADIARPEVGIITNIGLAHVGEIGSLESIASEKKAIFNSSSSVAVVSANEPWRDFLVGNFPGEVRLFGKWGEKNWIDFKDDGIKGYRIRRGRGEVKYPLAGRHNLLNAMAAVEAALALGVPESAIASGLESVKPADSRCEIIEGKYTVVRDCYNANPESLNAALEFFRGLKLTGRRIVILGELLELGNETIPALKVAGKTVARIEPEAVFLYGDTSISIEESLLASGYQGSLRRYTNMGQLKSDLLGYKKPGDIVLIKGSHGNALERLYDVFA